MQTTPLCTGKDATYHFKFYICMSFDFIHVIGLWMDIYYMCLELA